MRCDLAAVSPKGKRPPPPAPPTPPTPLRLEEGGPLLEEEAGMSADEVMARRLQRELNGFRTESPRRR